MLFAKVFCERDGSHGTFCLSFLLLLSFYNLSGHSFGYRSTSFYSNSFHCTSQTLRFLQIEGLWQPCSDKSVNALFANSVSSLPVSVSHLGNSRHIYNFFMTTVFVMVISDL